MNNVLHSSEYCLSPAYEYTMCITHTHTSQWQCVTMWNVIYKSIDMNTCVETNKIWFSISMPEHIHLSYSPLLTAGVYSASVTTVLVWSCRRTHTHVCNHIVCALDSFTLCLLASVSSVRLWHCMVAKPHTACIIEYFFVKFKQCVFEYWPDYTTTPYYVLLFYCTMYLLLLFLLLFDICATPFNHSISLLIAFCLCQYTAEHRTHNMFNGRFVFWPTWYE